MTINTGNIEYSVGINTTEMDKGAKKVEAGVNKINTKMTKVAESTSKASGILGRLGRNAGQVGIQFQQLAGQIQGGQDKLLAFGAQAADIGIVLGLPLVGAIAGLGAALVGTLVPSLSAASEEIKQILPPIDDLIDKIETLTLAQKDYVKAEVAKTIAEEENKLKEKNNRIEALIKNNQFLLRDEAKNAKQIDEQTGLIRKLRAERDQLVDSIRRQSEVVNNLTKAESNNASNSVSSENSALERIRTLAELNQTLDTQIATLGMSEREMALYSVSLLAVGDTEKSIVEALKQKINAHYDEVDAIKAKKEAQREFEKSQREEERDKSKAKTFAEGVISKGMTEDERFASELEKLTTLREQGLIDQQLYDDAIVASVENRARQIDNVNQKQEASEMARMNMLLSSSSNFFGAMADIVANGADEQSSAYKIMFGISKGFAAAQAALNLTTAISNASALPWPTNIPAMAQALAAGTQLVSSISGAQYNGGREMGGPVSAGSMYRVGERGPEIYSAGGKNYMIPGESGQVVNNKNAFGGGMSNVNVVVNNNAPNTVASASRDDAGNIEVIINELSSQVSTGQGKFARALKQGTNTQFKASV